MNVYVVLFASFLWLATLAGLLFLNHQQQSQDQRLIRELQKEKQDLLNRLMSGDLHAYTALTHVSRVEAQPINSLSVSMSDSAEAQRLVAAHGLGDALYDEETMDFKLAMGELLGRSD